ncbi:MAG: DUF4177 domain-containing protein [Sphingomonas sp.]|nr:MAG: DUF4177 domain-containing protein [Sphingomonas sp.]
MASQWEYNTATRYLLAGRWDWEEPQLKQMAVYEALDAVGREGWELVSAVSLNENGTTNEVQYLFKRPLR